MNQMLVLVMVPRLVLVIRSGQVVQDLTVPRLFVDFHLGLCNASDEFNLEE